MAYEEADKYGGKVILGDRPVQVNLCHSRICVLNLSLKERYALVYQFLISFC